jgi:hypothetical protein
MFAGAQVACCRARTFALSSLHNFLLERTAVHLAKTYKAMGNQDKYKEWLNKALSLESVRPLSPFR